MKRRFVGSAVLFAVTLGLINVVYSADDEEIIEYITTPDAGCDGTCPTRALCDVFLPILPIIEPR